MADQHIPDRTRLSCQRCRRWPLMSANYSRGCTRCCPARCERSTPSPLRPPPLNTDRDDLLSLQLWAHLLNGALNPRADVGDGDDGDDEDEEGTS